MARLCAVSGQKRGESHGGHQDDLDLTIRNQLANAVDTLRWPAISYTRSKVIDFALVVVSRRLGEGACLRWFTGCFHHAVHLAA